MKKYNSCGSGRIQDTHVENRTITDTPPPPPETIRYDISHYDCKKCGKIDMSADPGMPPHNNYTERVIRDDIIPQRNARHKTVTIQGRHVKITHIYIDCQQARHISCQSNSRIYTGP